MTKKTLVCAKCAHPLLTSKDFIDLPVTGNQNFTAIGCTACGALTAIVPNFSNLDDALHDVATELNEYNARLAAIEEKLGY